MAHVERINREKIYAGTVVDFYRDTMKLPDGRQLLHANRETIMVTPGFRRERISVNYEAPNGYIYSQRSDTGFNIIPPSKK